LGVYFIAVLLSFFSAEAGQKPKTFKAIFEKSLKSSKQQIAFWKEYKKFAVDYEKMLRQNKKKTSASLPWFPEAFAEDAAGVWCVNNGFIAQVAKCEKSNRWSFSVRDLEDYKSLESAGVVVECPAGQQPCSLAAGLSDKGTLFCAADSTNKCLNMGGVTASERLAGALYTCHNPPNPTAVSVGGRTVQCEGLRASVNGQMSNLEIMCAQAVKAVRSVCDKAKARMSLAVERAGLKEAATPPTENAASNSETDVLYIGDSHSANCFGSTLYNSLSSHVAKHGSTTLGVRSVATCGSGPSDWLAGHNSKCPGYRSCTIDKNCTTANSGGALSLDSYLKSDKPKLTVIALGTNSIRSTWEENKVAMLKLVEQVKAAGSRCLWVGPPEVGTNITSVEKYQALIDAMKTELPKAGCEFIDSSEFTDRNKITAAGEGMHYSCPDDGAAWANGVFGKMSPTLDQTHFRMTPEEEFNPTGEVQQEQ